jgi:hypothetical protein
MGKATRLVRPQTVTGDGEGEGRHRILVIHASLTLCGLA